MPLISVGASVVVRDDRRRILLQLRRDSGLWDLPGGSMDLGESFEETASRELEEETGLVPHDLRLLALCSGKEFFHRYPNGDPIYNAVAVFLAGSVTGTMRRQSDESMDLAFFERSDLPSMPIAGKRMLEEALKQLDLLS